MSVFASILARSGDEERPAIVGGSPLTYGALRSAVEELAEKLRAAGAGPGSRIGVSLDPGAGYLVSLLAVRAAGGATVLFGTSWTPSEQARIFAHAKPGWILGAMQPAVGEMPVAEDPVPAIGGKLYRYAAGDDAPPSEPGDAVIIYTSGTTGAPKGVVLTEEGLSANVRAVASYLDLTPEDSTVVFTPTCYAYAVSQFLTHALAGAAILPMPTFLRFPMAILQGVAVHRLTGLAANPTSFRILLGLDVPPDWDLSSVRYVMSGGQFLDARLVARLHERFPGTRVVNMYGATENGPRISYHWLEDRGADDPARFYPVGKAVEGTGIEIRDDEDRRVADGEVGEVVISGTSLMRGYWLDPETTAKRIRNGWLHTGDLGLLDPQGNLFLTGRSSNIINTGNEKVSPEEVERALLEIPGIAEAGVYARPDTVTGESVCAKIVVEPGAEVDLLEVQRHCRLVLSAYKVPREVTTVDALPRTLYGKMDRRKLKES